MFNPEHLITLQAVVEEGTVLAAADRLHLTPSAVSQQLSRLQREVGQPVMVRQGRTLAPTDAASVLVRLAQRMRDLDEATRADLERLMEQVGGSLVLAGFPTAVRGLLSPSLVLLQERHPRLDLVLRELTPEQSVRAVRRGDVDLAVVHDWTDQHVHVSGGVQTVAIGLDPVDLIAHRDHPLEVGPDGVDLDTLDGRVWIDDPPGVFSNWLLQALAERRLEYRVGATLDTFSSKVALVAQGFGIALLPRLGRDELPPEVLAVPLVEAPTRRVFAVHREASRRRPAVVAATEAMLEVWRGRAELPDASAQTWRDLPGGGIRPTARRGSGATAQPLLQG